MKKVLGVLGLNNLLIFFKRVKRLFNYLPIIWETHDFDYVYSLEIFKYQLDRLANTMKKNDRYVGTKRNVDRIKLINKLIDRVYLNDYYHDEMMSNLYKKYNKEYFTLNFKTVEDTNHYEIKQNYELLDDKELSKQIEQDYNDEFKKYENKTKKAKRLIWDILSKDIECFWD